LRITGYLLLLAALVLVVRQWPVLWELAVAGAIGGVWWFFFRSPR
jgi:hypothetical protein